MNMNNSSANWKGRIILTAVILAAGAAGVWYWKQPKEPPIEYQTATLARGEVAQTVTATGQLNPVKNVTVGSQISGIILNLHADFNSQVKAGDVIAELDAATYQANVASAEGDVANARANLELMQVDHRRAQELSKAKLIAQSDFDKTVASLHQAEAQVKIREASLLRAKVDLSRCKIYAPVDGIVISRSVNVGQTVAASLSAPELFVIANDLTKMQIDANVAEADVGGVEAGQEVEFTVDAFPLRTFQGKVIQVRNAPLTVQNVVTYDAVVEVSNDDLKLKPGMTATVSIIIARRPDALRIPNAALRFRPPEGTVPAEATNAIASASAEARAGGPGRGAGAGRGVGGGRGGARGATPRGDRQPIRTIYLLPGGTNSLAVGKVEFKPVQVRLGISDGSYTEALAGVNEGDVVVTGSTAPTATVPATGNPFGGGGMQRGMRRL